MLQPVASVPAMDLVAQGFSFPTSLTFDEEGVAYIAESGLPFGGAPRGGRIVRLSTDGRHVVVASGLRPPVNGLTYCHGALYISEGGHPGRISRINSAGVRETLIDGLPGPGNYHTNMVAIGPDERIYFSQGAMTNTGIVGLDAYEIGWLRRLPHACDIPAWDITLAGVNVETSDPTRAVEGAQTRTGAFVPFGTATTPGQRIAGSLPCTAAIMRCEPDGRRLELVAWGLRNAYGLGFLPDGRLLAIDQGSDDRGSRPVGNAPDLLYAVRRGAWYGWPDYIGGDPITDPMYQSERGSQPSFVLAHHSELPSPERPLLRFPPHSAPVKFDIARAGRWQGCLFVALFGDERPMTAPAGPRVGRRLVRIDPGDWSITAVDVGALYRPIDVRFSPTNGALHVLDFGEFEMLPDGGVCTRPGTGALWRCQVNC